MKTLLETIPAKVPELALLPKWLSTNPPLATSGSGYFALRDDPERLTRLQALNVSNAGEFLAFKGAKYDVNVVIRVYSSPEEAKRLFDSIIFSMDLPREAYADGIRLVHMGSINGYFSKYHVRVTVNLEIDRERADALARKTYDAVRDLLLPPAKK